VKDLLIYSVNNLLLSFLKLPHFPHKKLGLALAISIFYKGKGLLKNYPRHGFGQPDIERLMGVIAQFLGEVYPIRLEFTRDVFILHGIEFF
jgi:hypothetical protein